MNKTQIEDIENKHFQVYVHPFLFEGELSGLPDFFDIIEPDVRGFNKAINQHISKIETMCDGLNEEHLKYSLMTCQLVLFFYSNKTIHGILGLNTDDNKLHIEIVCTNNSEYKGIGTYLIQVANEIALKIGKTVLSLDAVKQAIPFYEKIGFRDVKRNTIPMDKLVENAPLPVLPNTLNLRRSKRSEKTPEPETDETYINRVIKYYRHIFQRGPKELIEYRDDVIRDILHDIDKYIIENPGGDKDYRQIEIFEKIMNGLEPQSSASSASVPSRESLVSQAVEPSVLSSASVTSLASVPSSESLHSSASVPSREPLVSQAVEPLVLSSASVPSSASASVPSSVSSSILSETPSTESPKNGGNMYARHNIKSKSKKRVNRRTKKRKHAHVKNRILQ